jgi:hypothetical protein
MLEWAQPLAGIKNHSNTHAETTNAYDADYKKRCVFRGVNFHRSKRLKWLLNRLMSVKLEVESKGASDERVAELVIEMHEIRADKIILETQTAEQRIAAYALKHEERDAVRAAKAAEGDRKRAEKEAEEEAQLVAKKAQRDAKWSAERCHFGILLIWPASSIAALPFWHPPRLAGVFFAALPFWHPPRLACVFHRRAAILASSYLAGIFHRVAAISASSFGRRLPSPRYHLSILVLPASSIAAPPQTAPSIAAPPSLISAGTFTCRATFSHLGRHFQLPRHLLSSRQAHSFALPLSLILARIRRAAISSIGWHIRLLRFHILSSGAFHCRTALSWLCNQSTVI